MTTRPEPASSCEACGGPLGAYSLRCPFCNARLGKGVERKRVRRVLFAFDRLFAFAQLEAPSPGAAGALGFGVGCLAFGLTYGVWGWGLLVSAAVAVASFFAIDAPLVIAVRRARRREQQRLFDGVIRPSLEAFMRDRKLSKERFDEIASGSLGETHPLRHFVPWPD